MKSQLFIILIISLSLFYSCIHKDPPGYNEIVFFDSTKSVFDSLVIMESFLNKIPKAKVINFFIDNHGKLVINNNSIGIWNKIKTDTSFIYNVDELKKFDNLDKLRLISLMSFLIRNEINGVYFYKQLNLFIFMYMESYSYYKEHDSRSIVIKQRFSERFYRIYKVIDEKDGLVLVAPDYSMIHKE